jgi:hypothetical protein
MEDSITVYEPAGRVREGAVVSIAKPSELHGSVIGIIDNTKPNFGRFAQLLVEALARNFGATAGLVIRKSGSAFPLAATEYDRLASSSQLVIAGSGD